MRRILNIHIGIDRACRPHLNFETKYDIPGLSIPEAPDDEWQAFDRKPSNVLLAENGNQALVPRITDFGLARLAEEATLTTSTARG